MAYLHSVYVQFDLFGRNFNVGQTHIQLNFMWIPIEHRNVMLFHFSIFIGHSISRLFYLFKHQFFFSNAFSLVDLVFALLLLLFSFQFETLNNVCLCTIRRKHMFGNV